ncbi:MAG: hypothetical protein U5J98_06750 [Halobacteriales archaeon]|nr:hypothetical protein [Halobacteriales archaeon]
MEELITSQPVVGYSMGRSTVLPENIDEDREEAFRREGVFRPPEDVEQNVGKKHLNHFIISAAETLDTEGFKSLFTGIVSALTESDGDAFDVEQAEELEAFFEGLDEEGWEELIYSIKNDENMVDILGED